MFPAKVSATPRWRIPIQAMTTAVVGTRQVKSKEEAIEWVKHYPQSLSRPRVRDGDRCSRRTILEPNSHQSRFREQKYEKEKNEKK